MKFTSLCSFSYCLSVSWQLFSVNAADPIFVGVRGKAKNADAGSSVGIQPLVRFYYILKFIYYQYCYFSGSSLVVQKEEW